MLSRKHERIFKLQGEKNTADSISKHNTSTVTYALMRASRLNASSENIKKSNYENDKTQLHYTRFCFSK